MPSTTPRGVNTSEFWLVVASLVLSVARLVASACGIHFSPDANTQANIATALPAIYAATRTWLKVNVPTIGNELPDIAGDDPNVPSSPSIGENAPQPSLDQSTPPAQIVTGVVSPAPDATLHVMPGITAPPAPPESPFIGANNSAA